jgi:probable rRNA maturation factor
VSVFLANEQPVEVEADELHRLADIILREEGFPEDSEVTILLVSDDEMAGYNERFLEREGPTDVLAFPVETLIPGVVPDTNQHGPPLILGDVLIAPDYVSRQASELGFKFRDEMALMLAHGILHLLGYDHEEDRAAERMERRESELLAMVGRKRR